ncbi:hypothetical protein SAMN02745245_01020 [Anaerosphaera aminiphila DSM 21120]|uniref:Uncharacterized protein n=1 Tax=Anaerosphaera aminiphila DSM 21120 TaxID=1120995 RepID=A0A1M5RVZ3_9FIRM|nr:hypothetical protein [Anaerosphaera aminiphila]SHH30475.1 hypothetical protein SAMN02745245_01020 [Anaerosphaera aminiphila DSM 21120]
MSILSHKLISKFNKIIINNCPNLSVRKIDYDLSLINKLRGKLSLIVGIVFEGRSVTNFMSSFI